MELIKVQTQQNMDAFLNTTLLGHAFIREVYSLSPSYKTVMELPIQTCQSTSLCLS